MRQTSMASRPMMPTMVLAVSFMPVSALRSMTRMSSSASCGPVTRRTNPLLM